MININDDESYIINIYNSYYKSDSDNCDPYDDPYCDPNCDPTCSPTCSPSCSPCYPGSHCNPDIFYCNPDK